MKAPLTDCESYGVPPRLGSGVFVGSKGVVHVDTPGNIITCVWCIVDKDWPVGLSSMNPCGEIELET